MPPAAFLLAPASFAAHAVPRRARQLAGCAFFAATLPRSALRPAPTLRMAADQEDNNPQQARYNLRTRLREETEAPFRKVRLFIYAASAASASVGTFISFMRVLANFAGVSGTQPLSELGVNIAVNAGVIATAIALARVDLKSGEKRLERMSRGATLAALRAKYVNAVEDTALSALRGQKRVVVVAGFDAKKITASVDNASKYAGHWERTDVVVVPLLPAGPGEDSRWPLKWTGNWIMQPRGPQWEKWLKNEIEFGKLKQPQTDLIVTIIRKDGKVGARSVGPPMWERLVKELESLPKTDKYGKP